MPGLQIDRTKTANQNILALILTASSYAWAGTEFTIGAASAQTPADPQEKSNSQLTLTAIDGSGFTGTKTLRYARLELGHTRPGAKTTYVIGNSDTNATLKSAIAVEHNLVESDFDIAGSLPAAGAPDASFTVTAAANSHLYFGTFNVTVQHPA